MTAPGSAAEPRRSQRTFSVSLAVIGALVAWHAARRGQLSVALAAGGVGLLAVALGWLAPGTLRVPSAVWWRMLHALGWVNARVLLSILFVVVVTPLGLAKRCFGWDPLARRGFRSGRSGWVPYPERQRDPKHYERMY